MKHPDALKRPDVNQINQLVEFWSQSMPEVKVHWRLSSLPAGMQGALARYAVFGIPTGKFLKAVLSNDLMAAAREADDYHRKHMFEQSLVLFDLMPRASLGSEKNYLAWIKAGGLYGK